jgi:hypothetical protein
MRITTKRWDKRKAFVGEIFWILGLAWGAIGIVMLSIALLSWLTRMTLG